MLFGDAAETPAQCIGRYVGLNLCRVCSYGTVEFRRYHATLDPGAVVRWAHFCVAFVETFCNEVEAVKEVFGPSIEDGRAWLRSEQENATISHLMDSLVAAGFHEYGDQDFVDCLLREGGLAK